MISTVDVLKVASKRTKPLPKFPQFARVLELSVVDLLALGTRELLWQRRVCASHL